MRIQNAQYYICVESDRDMAAPAIYERLRGKGYDALKIIHVFMAALHYAGFHDFADEVQEYWNKGAEREEQISHLPKGSLKVGF